MKLFLWIFLEKSYNVRTSGFENPVPLKEPEVETSHTLYNIVVSTPPITITTLHHHPTIMSYMYDTCIVLYCIGLVLGTYMFKKMDDSKRLAENLDSEAEEAYAENLYHFIRLCSVMSEFETAPTSTLVHGG